MSPVSNPLEDLRGDKRHFMVTWTSDEYITNIFGKDTMNLLIRASWLPIRQDHSKRQRSIQQAHKPMKMNPTASLSIVACWTKDRNSHNRVWGFNSSIFGTYAPRLYSEQTKPLLISSVRRIKFPPNRPTDPNVLEIFNVVHAFCWKVDLYTV